MIEAEVLLDFADDLPEHVYRIVARNSGARNIVEECQLAGTPLLLGEQSRIFHRNRYLARRGHEHVEVALLEHKLLFGAHGDHNSRRLVAQQDRRHAQALGGMLRPVGDAQSSTRLLQVGPDQQWLPGADHVFGEGILRLARPFGQNAIVLDFQLEADFVPFLEGDVKVAGIENLP